MIIFNGLKFAKNDKEFTESLFVSSGGTCTGFYKRTKNGFKLYNQHKNPIAFIGNMPQFKGIVTMGKREDGKEYYMHGLSSMDSARLMMQGLSYSQENQLIEQFIKANA